MFQGEMPNMIAGGTLVQSVHCIALHCIALHYITLHWIALHCTEYNDEVEH